MSAEVNRRNVFKTFAAAMAFGSSPLQLSARETDAPLFFSKPDFALLDLLTEMIVPSDDHSPGAHAAGVAKYIDNFVARSVDPDEKTSWTKGLALVNSISQEINQLPFSAARKKQQLEVLKRMSVNEKSPSNPAEKFWGQLKQTTAFVYYTSSVGIHEEMNYKGNVILEQFAGFDAT